jgi:hypothetical protein
MQCRFDWYGTSLYLIRRIVLNLVGLDAEFKSMFVALRQKLRSRPNVISDLMGHRGNNAQRFVNTAEVVKRVPQGHSSPVALPLFAKGVRKASEATATHA